MKKEAGEVYYSFTSLLDHSDRLYFPVMSVHLNYSAGKNQLLNFKITRKIEKD